MVISNITKNNLNEVGVSSSASTGRPINNDSAPKKPARGIIREDSTGGIQSQKSTSNLFSEASAPKTRKSTLKPSSSYPTSPKHEVSVGWPKLKAAAKLPDNLSSKEIKNLPGKSRSLLDANKRRIPSSDLSKPQIVAEKIGTTFNASTIGGRQTILEKLEKELGKGNTSGFVNPKGYENEYQVDTGKRNYPLSANKRVSFEVLDAPSNRWSS